MERLDGPLADLISAEREDMEALPRSREAAWAGIAAGLQLPPPPPPPGGAAAAATAGKAAAASKAGVLKIVAAAVVGTSVAAGAWVATRDDAPADPIEVSAAVPASPVVEGKPEPEPEPEPEPAPEPEAEPEPKPKPKPKPKPAVAKPEPKPAGLAEELVLIDAIRKDVAAGRYGKALARAKEHRKRFATGRLTADRLDLEAAARCGQGNLEAGRSLAETKKKRWPRAPISERLRTLCRLD